MEAATTEAPPARLKARYFEEIRPSLIKRFEYTSPMQAPRVEKITLNMGVGLAKQDSKVLKAATEQLATIAGQQPSVRRARKSIAAFKLREGMPVGVAVTLRNERAYEFLDRLVSVAIPRIRDFRGLNPRSFDGRGNYSMGVREQIIFPEIDYDAIDQVRGMDITISTTAASDAEAYALLQALGMPFAAQGRPKGFDPQADEAEAQARAAAHAEAQAAAAAAPAAPAKKAPKAAKPEPAAEEPAAEAAAAEPAAEEPVAEEPVAEEPAAEEPVAEEAAEPEAQAAAESETESAEQAAPTAEPEQATQDADEAQASGEDTTAPDEQAADTAEKESSD
jgi:large subunit ribosomal protein L5